MYRCHGRGGHKTKKLYLPFVALTLPLDFELSACPGQNIFLEGRRFYLGRGFLLRVEKHQTQRSVARLSRWHECSAGSAQTCSMPAIVAAVKIFSVCLASMTLGPTPAALSSTYPTAYAYFVPSVKTQRKFEEPFYRFEVL
jgi:hypothetical protein